MCRVKDIYEELCRMAPLSLQLDFDNAGLLVGREERRVSRVLLALDITAPVVDEAERLGAELIVAHHPVIFTGLKNLRSDPENEKLLRLVRADIAAICMHTNLDIAQGGVNDVLLRLLGAAGERPLDSDGCGRAGELPVPVPLSDFLARCKERLRAPGLRYVDAGRPVHRLAVLGGAGGHAVRDAYEKGCDTYLSADIKYHQFLQAKELGLNLIDAGHFSTENPVMAVVRERLAERFAQVEFRLSQDHDDPTRFC